MDFLNDLLLVPLLVGPIFIISGIILNLFPPKKISSLYGYRTINSMKSQERWDYAQKVSALELIKLGSILTILSFLGIFINFSEIIEILIGLGLIITVIIILFIRIERAINRKCNSSKR